MMDNTSLHLPLVFSSTPNITEPAKIKRALSDPDCLVHMYKVHSPTNHANFVVKVFPKDKFGTTHYEKEKLIANLNHPNIIHYVPTINNNNSPLVLVTEFAENGTFLDSLLHNLLNHEVLIRTYFHQLIEGLEYLHSKGIAHLDLKLENLVLGSDLKLKFIDFDQAKMTQLSQQEERWDTGPLLMCILQVKHKKRLSLLVNIFFSSQSFQPRFSELHDQALIRYTTLTFLFALSEVSFLDHHRAFHS